MYVSLRGFEIPQTDAAACDRARKNLTFTLPEPSRLIVRAYKEDEDTLVVPFHYGQREFGSDTVIRDTRPSGASLGEDVAHFSGSLRQSQREPVNRTLECLRERKGAILNLPTGAGKTACALYIAAALRAKTLIVVHKSFLADQFRERLKQFLPNARVTTIQGTVCDTSGDFVVAMIQTLISRKYPSSLFACFKLLIFDEAHHVAARVFSQAMFSMNMEYTLGLTATPKRKDGLDRLLHDFLGPMSYIQAQLHRPSAVSVLIKPYFTETYRTPPPRNRRGDVDHVRMISMVSEDNSRTHWIAECLTEYRARDILILSHRRQHCQALVEALQATGFDAATYLGGATTVPDTRVVASTFAFVAEGFDEPRFDVLVLATPASDVTQASGRVMRRLHEPDCHPLIIDIVDQWSILFSQAAKRKSFYIKSGFHIESTSKKSIFLQD